MKLSPVDFDDYRRLAPFFARQPYRLCVYSLPCLLAWHTREYRPLAAVAGDRLVVGCEFATLKRNRHLILPVFSNGCSPDGFDTPDGLARLAETLGFDQYWYVPEAYIEAHGREAVERRFAVSRQETLDDYVYRASDLAGLKGNRYAKKRNLVHQFTRDFLDPGRVSVEVLTRSALPECMAFLDRWCEQRDCDADQETDLACEKQATANMLENIARVDAKGLLARVDGVVSAFAVGCRLTAEMGVMHFQKADPKIKGLYQYFDQICAARLFEGYELINKESDMQVPGLAQAKRSYHPVRMIRSHCLALR